MVLVDHALQPVAPARILVDLVERPYADKRFKAGSDEYIRSGNVASTGEYSISPTRSFTGWVKSISERSPLWVSTRKSTTNRPLSMPRGTSVNYTSPVLPCSSIASLISASSWNPWRQIHWHD
jgi:hypothetical protein